jgi:DNA-binding MarR family transcriptional regulator/predicted transcriptional regulator
MLMNEQPKRGLDADEERILTHLSIPLTSSELSEELGIQQKMVLDLLGRLRDRQLVKMLNLSPRERVYIRDETPASTVMTMIRARMDGLPPILGVGNRRHWLSDAEVRVAGCVGRSEGYLSISELSRETGVLRDPLRRMLFDLVWQGVLSEEPLSGGRKQYRLVGLTLEQVEALEEMPRSPARRSHPSERDGRVGTSPPERNVEPTENEAKVIEFLTKPATQEEIAERFGYGKSRRSEVIRYVRTEVSDEEAEAYFMDLRKDEREAERRREEIVYDLIAEPMTLLQVAERTGFGDAEVRSSVASLLSQGKAISIRSSGGTRYARADSPDTLARAALKWKDVRLRQRELEVLNCLESIGRPATAKEISGASGSRYVSTCYDLRMLISYGLVTREKDRAPRSRMGPGSFLFSLKPRIHAR